MSARRPLATLLLAALALPGPALAASNAPPGNSGVDQYFESVPGASGNQRPGGVSGGGLPKDKRRALQGQGADGKALAKAIAAAPGPAAAHAQPDGKSSVGAVAAPPSRLGSVAKPLIGDTGGAGTGFLLPVLMVMSGLGAVGFLLVRRLRG